MHSVPRIHTSPLNPNHQVWEKFTQTSFHNCFYLSALPCGGQSQIKPKGLPTTWLWSKPSLPLPWWLGLYLLANQGCYPPLQVNNKTSGGGPILSVTRNRRRPSISCLSTPTIPPQPVHRSPARNPRELWTLCVAQNIMLWPQTVTHCFDQKPKDL